MEEDYEILKPISGKGYSNWDRLSEEKKEEYKKKAEEKRKIAEVARLKLVRDINLGKQKTILNSW